MPSRPVWGSATSDMHFFKQTQFAFTVFVLDELTTEGVKEAMQAGRFYAVVGPATMDLRESGQAAYDGTYPELRSISVDRNAAEISIDAANYDEIVWISKPASGRVSIDAERGLSWPPGEVVQRGPVFNYSNADAALPYVRARTDTPYRKRPDSPVPQSVRPHAAISLGLKHLQSRGSTCVDSTCRYFESGRKQRIEELHLLGRIRQSDRTSVPIGAVSFEPEARTSCARLIPILGCSTFE